MAPKRGKWHVASSNESGSIVSLSSTKPGGKKTAARGPKGCGKSKSPAGSVDTIPARCGKHPATILPGVADADGPLDEITPIREQGAECQCLRCDATVIPDDSVPLSVRACGRCYAPMPAFNVLGFSFPHVCGQIKADEEFAVKYEGACKMTELSPDDRPYPLDEIKARKTLGYKVCANFLGTPNDEMASGSTHGMKAADLQESVSSLPSPFGGEMDDLVITKDGTKPFIQIQMYCNVELDHEVVKLSDKKRCTQGQPEEAWAKMRKMLTDNVPVQLRGNKLPPTLEFLRKKAAGVLGITDPAVAGARPAVPRFQDPGENVASSTAVGNSSAASSDPAPTSGQTSLLGSALRRSNACIFPHQRWSQLQ